MPRAKKSKSLFSKRLTRLREERKCTQQELARMMGVPRATIDYYETRADNPRLSTIKKLAEFFGVPPEHFLAEDDASTVQENLERVTRLPEDKQTEAGKLLDQLLDDEDTDD